MSNGQFMVMFYTGAYPQDCVYRYRLFYAAITAAA